jgi:hypothetical protein
LNGDNLAAGFSRRSGIFGGLLENFASPTRDVDSTAILSEGGGGDETETGPTTSNWIADGKE